MPRQKKVDRYISLAAELFAKRDAGTLPKGGENEYQVKLGKIWGTLTKPDKAKVEQWVNENLVQQEEGMVRGVKHLIECNCSLPQYRNRPERVFHRFTVFSVVDENDQVQPKYVQCNNCGAIHKIVELGRSEFTGKDESHAILTIEDAKRSIPPDVREVLDDYKLELPYWEEASFICEHQRWGAHLVISSEENSGEIITKILRFLGPGMVKIETLTDQASIS